MPSLEREVPSLRTSRGVHRLRSRDIDDGDFIQHIFNAYAGGGLRLLCACKKTVTTCRRGQRMVRYGWAFYPAAGSVNVDLAVIL